MAKRDKLLLALLFSIVLFASLASATATLVTPASSATVSGTTVAWNASFSSFANPMNCSVYVSSPSTANTTAVNISTSTNSSVNAVFINGTFNSNLVEDSNDYSVYASCVNQTSTTQNSSANTAIVFDNTIPQAPTSLTPADASRDTDGSVTFTGTVTARNTTGCTLLFNGQNPGTSSYTMTHTTNSCTHTLSSVPEQSYQWYIRASDGTNTTNSATQTITVDGTTSAGKAVLLAQQKGVEPLGGALLSVSGEGIEDKIPGGLVTIVVVVVLVMVILIARKK